MVEGSSKREWRLQTRGFGEGKSIKENGKQLRDSRSGGNFHRGD